MTLGIHNTGKEWRLDYIFLDETGVSSLDVGLFNDSTDNLNEEDDIGDITTEPVGSAYVRQSVSFGINFTNSFDSENWQTVFDDLTFDLSDSSQIVNAVFVVVHFDSDYAGDGGTAQDHLLFTRPLGATWDASVIDGTKTVMQVTETLGG